MAINNTITLIGNLGKDPAEYTSDNYKNYVGVTICVTDSYKNEQEQWVNTSPQWFFVSFLGEAAQGYARNFRAGQRVKITGKLSAYQVPTANGHTETRLSVIGRKIELAPLPKRHAAKSTAEAAAASPSNF